MEGATFRAWLVIPIGILAIIIIFAFISRAFREEEQELNYKKKSNLVPISAVMLQDHDEFRPSLFNDSFMQAASPWSDNTASARTDTNFSEYVGALEGMYGDTNPKEDPIYDDGEDDSRMPGGDSYLDINDDEEVTNEAEGYLDMNETEEIAMPVLRKPKPRLLAEDLPATERVLTEEETRDQWRSEWDKKRETAKAMVAEKETAKPTEESDPSQDETNNAWQQEFEKKREANKLRMEAVQEAESIHASEGGDASAPSWQQDFAKAKVKAASAREKVQEKAAVASSEGDEGGLAADLASNHILGLLRGEAGLGGLGLGGLESPFGDNDDEDMDDLVASAFSKGDSVSATAVAEEPAGGQSFRELRKGKKQKKKSKKAKAESDGAAMAF
jgi:hypothetical protein